MGKKMLARVGAVVAGGALAFTIASPALADHVDVETDPASTVTVQDPSEVDVTPDDGPAACDEDSKLKMGTGSGLDGAITVTEEAGDDPHYTVSTDGSVVITEVHLKGGGGEDAYTSFFFNPAVTEAEHLWTKNNAGKIADLSHIWICFEEPDETPPPETTPPEETTPPGETTPPEDEPKLPVTGAQFGGLLILGGGLLAAGLAMVAVRRRRNISDILEG